MEMEESLTATKNGELEGLPLPSPALLPSPAVCKHWQRTGHCLYGERCRFQHPPLPPPNDDRKEEENKAPIKKPKKLPGQSGYGDVEFSHPLHIFFFFSD
jgi:hypothetical protein